MNQNVIAQPDHILASASRTLKIEIEGLHHVKDRLDHNFVKAVTQVLNCKGRVVITGLGKSGHIARKIAATLASTGTPAFFMHAAEAVHGDLGMITSQDLIIAISYSGSGAELNTIISVAKRLGTKIIAITGNTGSDLAKQSDILLNVQIEREACPLNLAPTTSTTATLAMGDAIAVASLEARGFSRDDFALSHPGGALGRQLLTRVQDIMRQGNSLPLVTSNTSIPEALKQMSAKGMGMTIVIDSDHKPIGLFTDGDLRRLIISRGDIRTLTVSAGMTKNPHSVAPETMAIEAAAVMDTRRINQILVTNSQGQLMGALHMHDLLAAKVI